MMTTVSFALPKVASSIFRSAFSMTSHRSVKLLLGTSVLLHLAEFFICSFFFTQASAPFFVAPTATLIDGKESFLYAYSITRQYGFFTVQLSLLALFAATNPPLYQHAVRILALARLAMAGFGLYAFAQGNLTLFQLMPSFLSNVGLAALLLRHCPTERLPLTVVQDLNGVSDKYTLGIKLTPSVQRRLLQALCIIAGGLWMLWGLGSTVFWEIGVANISSDRAAELNLLNAMQANHIVRNQQGLLLFSIGAATALGAYFPMSHVRLLEFVMAQQVINATSAVVELMFGAIFLPQFLTVFSAQVVTYLVVYMLYPTATAVGDSVELMAEEKR